jgi:hypothetical protein
MILTLSFTAWLTQLNNTLMNTLKQFSKTTHKLFTATLILGAGLQYASGGNEPTPWTNRSGINANQGSNRNQANQRPPNSGDSRNQINPGGHSDRPELNPEGRTNRPSNVEEISARALGEYLELKYSFIKQFREVDPQFYARHLQAFVREIQIMQAICRVYLSQVYALISNRSLPAMNLPNLSTAGLGNFENVTTKLFMRYLEIQFNLIQQLKNSPNQRLYVSKRQRFNEQLQVFIQTFGLYQSTVGGR